MKVSKSPPEVEFSHMFRSGFWWRQLNIRNKEAAAECYRRTEICLEGIIDKISEEAALLTMLAESISLLDMIVNSFAFMVSSKDMGNYSRPEFTDDGPLAIEAGRHPVVEILYPEQFVPNNLFLSEASNMVLVTGPNMSGKSTYLRQVALITILAHIGSYIPAQFASFRVVDHIFTRIGSGDNLEFNSSTFMMEMRETAFILENITPRSLVLLDELGRATSSVDGLAIAWSCCEHLLSLKAYTIFATHMQRLIELPSIYPNVKVCHFHVDITNNRLDFKFSLKEGHAIVPHYGLLLLEAAGFPSEVVERAKKITEKLNEKEVVRMNDGYSSSFPLRKEYHVAQRLLCLKYANLSEESLRSYIQNLKDAYTDGELPVTA